MVAAAETLTRPDLVWDSEVPGLCVRVHGNGGKAFIFVYRRDNRQRFVRVGTTPRWSIDGARRWAKQLRSAADEGHDPELYNRERQNIDRVIQSIAEAKQIVPAVINRATIIQRLRETELRMWLEEYHVTTQKRIIDQLERDGENTQAAKEQSARFEELVGVFRAERERLKAKLAKLGRDNE
jgi:Arm DNA-binding domain